MSKDDSNGGFLSKVVKFVRHPTTSWADLDTRQADRESEYSKAALKEMIERKRRNDFVRKREFDMLRKIRSREGSSGEAQGLRPSFFQSSLPSKPDDRAMTLKKIDEIEAQMSMQWWKTKGADSTTATSGSAGLNAGAQPSAASSRRSIDAAPSRPLSVSVDPARVRAQYGATEPAPLLNPVVAGAGAASQAGRSARVVATAPAPAGTPARTGLMVPTTGLPSGQGSRFSASDFFALDVQEVAQDPEVEEAAIRFANGDDAGAEQGLLEALSEGGPRIDQVADWLALFDLYRATGQLAAFEGRAIEFANRFGRSAPQWCDMPAAVAQLTGKAAAPAAAPAAATSVRAIWVAEPELDAHAMGTLQNVMLRARQPWVLDWSPLKSMDVKAARALLGLVTLWSDQDIELRFAGAAALRALLKSMTLSGRRDVEQLWWELRMALLRLMNRPDEFELTALDFCVTYEVSPPGWEKPRCRYRSVAGDSGDDGGVTSVLGDAMSETVMSTLSGESVMDSQTGALSHLTLVELSGEIRGDAQVTIDMLERRLGGADVLILSCRNLIRVDFSAAGSLLNWVSAHHAQGRLVQFVDVHRLVSAFFHVIGITENAKVVLRND